MNRRNCIKLLAGLLPCSLVAKLLGQTVETQTQDYWHCTLQTNNLTPLSDEGLVKELDRLSYGVNNMLVKAKQRGLEIIDIKFCWRNIITEYGPDRFIRVLIRSRQR